jgi:hypothetical protein
MIESTFPLPTRMDLWKQQQDLRLAAEILRRIQAKALRDCLFIIQSQREEIAELLRRLGEQRTSDSPETEITMEEKRLLQDAAAGHIEQIRKDKLRANLVLARAAQKSRREAGEKSRMQARLAAEIG